MDYSLLALHIVGIMLFLLSPMFAESNVFYYLAAALVGVSTSFIIALYFLLKLFSFKVSFKTLYYKSKYWAILSVCF